MSPARSASAAAALLALVALASAGGPWSRAAAQAAPADTATAPDVPVGGAAELEPAPLESLVSDEERAWEGPLRLDSLLAQAAAARQRGDAFAAARAAARVATESGAATGAEERKRSASRREEATRILRAVAGKLGPAEAACAAAWGGPAPDLALRYARAMLAARRPADAAAEALAVLAEDPAGPRAGDAVSVLEDAGRRPTHAGGAHHSVYRVAAFLPLTGDYARYGHSLAAGLRQAIDEANRGARLPFRLTLHDTGGEAWQAAAAARRALDAGSGVFVGAALSLPTLVLAGSAQAHGIPLLSPSAPDETVGEAGPVVFQTGLSAAEQGRALARHAVQSLRAVRIAVAVADDPAGRAGMRPAAASAADSLLGPGAADFAAAFAGQATALGATVTAVGTPAGSRDARGAVNALRRARADALLLPSDPAQAEIWIGALVRERFMVRLLGSEAIDPQFLHPDLRREVEGMVLVGQDYALPETLFVPLDAGVRARFGVQADRMVRRGYLTGRLLTRTVQRGAVSPAMLAEELGRRLAPPAAPGRSAHGFILHPSSEVRVPLQLVRRGALVRVQ